MFPAQKLTIIEYVNTIVISLVYTGEVEEGPVKYPQIYQIIKVAK